MGSNIEKYKAAVGTKSKYGREHAEAAYHEFMACLTGMADELAEIGVSRNALPNGKGFVLHTPYGDISARKTYVLDDDCASMVLVFTSPSGHGEELDQLGALHLRWKGPWAFDTGAYFTQDFDTDKYPDWVAHRCVIEVMARKLEAETLRYPVPKLPS